MPPIGFITGGVDFSELSIILKEATEETTEIAINYGAFINTTLDFIIIAFTIFIAIKQINKLKKKEEEKPKKEPKISKEEELLTEIRDLLKK